MHRQKNRISQAVEFWHILISVILLEINSKQCLFIYFPLQGAVPLEHLFPVQSKDNIQVLHKEYKHLAMLCRDKTNKK